MKTKDQDQKRLDDPNYVQIKNNMFRFAATMKDIGENLKKRKDVGRMLSNTPFLKLIEAYMKKRFIK